MSQYRLPDAYSRTGDPVDGNPFAVQDPRHKVWSEATREAEEEVARTKAAALLASTCVDPSREGARLLLFAAVETHGAIFDAWAKRGITVLWSDDEMHSYDQWLVAYANAMINAVEESHAAHAIASSMVPVEGLLVRLRNLLGGRVHHWKAEARRYRADQEGHRAERESTFKPPSAVSADVLEKRKRLVKDFRRREGLTVPDLARKAGMSDSSLRAVMKEDRDRGFADDTRDRLLGVLGIPLRTWYDP
jgi:hypothetical protein